MVSMHFKTYYFPRKLKKTIFANLPRDAIRHKLKMCLIIFAIQENQPVFPTEFWWLGLFMLLETTHHSCHLESIWIRKTTQE